MIFRNRRILSATTAAITQTRRTARNATRSVRLAFETLEDRTVLALAAPSLIAPAGVIMNATPTFAWSAVTGAKFYDIMVNDVTTGQPQVLRNTHATGTLWTATSPLNLGQSYQWFVRAMTSTSSGPWSSAGSFTVINPFAGAYTGTYSGTTTDGDVFTDLPVTATIDGTGAITVTDPGLGRGQITLSGDTQITGTFGFGAVTDASYTFSGSLMVVSAPAVHVTGTGTWTALYEGGTGSGTWQVSADTGDLVGAPLEAPVTGTPNNPTIDATPSFQWNAVTGASYYDVWVDDLTTGELRVLRNAHNVGTSWTPGSPLTPGHDYSWSVRAMDDGGTTSPASIPATFVVSPLQTPTPTGATGAITNRTPNLTWSAVTDASSYQLWVHDITTGATALDTRVSATSLTISLVLGHSYEYRVRAFSSSGNVSPWSDAPAFSIILASPTPTGPSGAGLDANPTFSWSAVANAAFYAIRVDDVTTGQSQVRRSLQIAGTSWRTTPFVAGHQYQWWVRAIAASGVSSAWSTTTTFFVTPLAKPVVMSPGGFVQDTSPTYIWNAVSGADYYDVSVIDISAGGASVLRNNKVVGTSLAGPTLTAGHDYQWMARALSNSGNASAWTAATVFTVTSPFAGVYAGTFTGTEADGTPVTGTVNAIVAANGAITITDPGSGSGTVSTSGAMSVTGRGFDVVESASFTFTGTFLIGAGVNGAQGTWSAKWPAGGGFPAGTASGQWNVTATSVLGTPLDTPELTGPLGSIVDRWPRLTWNPVADANYYDVWVQDVSASNAPVVRNTHVVNPYLSIASALTVGHTYRWQVQAHTDEGSASAWSDWKSFTVARLTVPPFTYHAYAFTGTYPTPAYVAYVNVEGSNTQVLAYPGQVQVIAAGVSESAMHALIEDHAGTVVAQTPSLGHYLVSVTPGAEATFIAEMVDNVHVQMASPNTVFFRGAYANVHQLIAANGDLPSVVSINGTVGTNTGLYAIDDFVNNDMHPVGPGGVPCDATNHGDMVTYVQSKDLAATALGVNIFKPAASDGLIANDTWASAIALIGQSLATRPTERAIINISIYGRGDTDEESRAAQLAKLELYAAMLGAVKELDPSVYARIQVVAIAGNSGVNLHQEIVTLRSDFPEIFGVGPSAGVPKMLIVGGTLAGSTAINQNLNYSSADISSGQGTDMIYAPSQQVVVSADGCTASGTSFAAPAVANLLARILIANPTITVAQATQALLTAYASKGSLPSYVEAQFAVNGFPAISVSDVTLTEGTGAATSFGFTVGLSSASSKTVKVTFATANATAGAASDYTARSGTLTFAPGETSKTVNVAVTADNLVEPDETFYLNLSVPVNAVLDDGKGLATIVNDDATSISINNVSLDEGNSGTTPFVFTVTLSNPNTQTVTVDYATANDSALAGADYVAVSGTLTFAPGILSKTVTVQVNGNTTFEPAKIFRVNLSNPDNADLGTTPGTGTITNDDGIRISGVVTNVNTGARLAGATLLMVDNATQYSTLSASNGAYRLYVDPDLALQTSYAVLQASLANYEDKAISVNLSVGSQTKNVALKPLTNRVILVESALHHLGDGNFSTPLNAGLQRLSAEPGPFFTSFNVTATQLNYTRAWLEITVNGAESGDTIALNGTVIEYLYNSVVGPEPFQIAFDINLLHEGSNSLTITSLTGDYGDLDDFEFSNVRLRLA